MSIYDDVRALIERIDDTTPAWISHPVGELKFNPWIPGDEVLVVNGEMLGGLEPFVFISPINYQKMRQLIDNDVRWPLTDKQIAGFFVERARAKRAGL